MRALLLSGGGFKGAVQVPVIKRLLDLNKYDIILGTSVGSLNGVMAAQGRIPELAALWNALDDNASIDGIKGFLAPSIHRWKGLYSLNPLRDRAKDFVEPSRLLCTFGCGIVARQTAQHKLLTFNKQSNKSDVINGIIASSAISGIMEPVEVGNELWCDGGHIHPIPMPLDLEDVDWTDVDVVCCNPLTSEERPTSKVNGLLEALTWAADMQMHGQLSGDIEVLKLLASESRHITVYAPLSSPGGMLEASRDTIQYRFRLGREMYDNPVRF